jgi:hypothetical protein
MKSETPMKRTFGIGSLLLALACAGVATSARADTVTLDLTTPFGPYSSPPPNSSDITGTSLTATFTDVTGGVDMTLSAPNLAAGYSVNTWWLNLASSYENTLSFTPLNSSPGLNTPNISSGLSEVVPGVFSDFWLNNFSSTFVSGDSIEYYITSSSPGFDAADFKNLDTSGTYYSEAQLEGGNSGGGLFYYLGATGYTDVSGLPDGGSTLAFLGLALSGLGGLAKKLRKV